MDCSQTGTKFVFHTGRDYYDELILLIMALTLQL